MECLLEDSKENVVCREPRTSDKTRMSLAGPWNADDGRVCFSSVAGDPILVSRYSNGLRGVLAWCVRG